jgi:hypothetical protein
MNLQSVVNMVRAGFAAVHPHFRTARTVCTVIAAMAGIFAFFAFTPLQVIFWVSCLAGPAAFCVLVSPAPLRWRT